MGLIQHRCQGCGGDLRLMDDNRLKCDYCGNVYEQETAENNTKNFKEMFDEAKQEIVCNLRRNLYDAVNAEYISSIDVKNCAAELKKYLPDDFAANFYEVAVGNNVKRLTKYIRGINVDQNYSEIENAIRFLIKSLQTEYLLELNNLVERAYKNRNLSLFEKYSTAVSKEAEKVVNGVYEVKMPREVFIAYSSKDMEKVSELCETLEEQGLRCFVAARNLRHGKGSVENYDALLSEAMDHCRSFVFVSSTNSRTFNCDALIKELPYIQQKDIENAPAEFKNSYGSMPHSYKKPRVEYRIEESRGFNAADSISNDFFDGYERVYSPEAVAERVVKQLVAADKTKSAPATKPVAQKLSETYQAVPTSNVPALLKRAFMFLEDEEWDRADALCEQILNQDPENAMAYVAKLMCDLEVSNQDALGKLNETFEDNGNYKKALRFADEELYKTLKGYIVSIEQAIEAKRKDRIYLAARASMNDDTVLGYREAIAKFGEIPDWRDSNEQIQTCQRRINEIRDRAEANRKNEIYNKAISGLNAKPISPAHDIKIVTNALNGFNSIADWRDSRDKIEECKLKLQKLKVDLEEERKEKLRLEELRRQTLRRRAKISAIVIAIVCAILVFALILTNVIIPEINSSTIYNNAIELMEAGKYEQAIDAFEALDGYKDSAKYIRDCNNSIEQERLSAEYQKAVDFMDSGKYEEAIAIFNEINNYKDSAQKISECEFAIKDLSYNKAIALMNAGKYSEAIDAFKAIAKHKDAAAKIAECRNAIKDISYEEALALMNEGKYAEAIVAFKVLGAHKDSVAKITECRNAIKDISYEEALALMNEGKYAEAIVAFEALGTHRDSVDKIAECETAIKDISYEEALALMNEGKYAEAVVAFEALGTHKDSADKIIECNTEISYIAAMALIEEGKYSRAIEILESIAECKDINLILAECRKALNSTEGLAYLVSDDGSYASVIGYAGSATDVVIAAEYEGVPVKEIETSVFRSKPITSITIPPSITQIGNNAFDGCSSLTSVYIHSISRWVEIYFANTYSNPLYYASKLYVAGQLIIDLLIPNDITVIGDKAFYGFSGLNSVVISEGVNKIGYSAFAYCKNLKSVTLPSSLSGIDSHAFSNCANLDSLYISNLSNWCQVAFEDIYANPLYYASKLYISEQLTVDLLIPNDITAIGDRAFYGFSGLNSVVIPEGVNEIGYSAFAYCKNLKSVTLPSSLSAINSHAFSNCANLDSVYISNLSNWCQVAFEDLYANPLYYASKLYISEQLTVDLLIPNDITAIGDRAFYGFSGLNSVVIPEGVNEIGYSAFAYCKNLKSVTLPSSLSSIAYYAFGNCTNVSSVNYSGTATQWFQISFGTGNDSISNATVNFK